MAKRYCLSRPAWASVVAIVCCTQLAAQWTDVNDPPVPNVRGMHFFDADTGVVCGTGSIQRTTDGGTTWQTVATFTQDANDLDFTADGVHGICGLDSGQVLVSHDAGVTWELFAVDGSGAAAWEVDIADGQTLFADMYLEPTFYSTDGGENWTSYGVPNFQEMHFLDDTLGFYCSLGEVYGTTDGGLNWTLLNDDLPVNLKGLVFTDALHGWLAGADGYIARTTNGGLGWAQQYLDGTNISTLYDIDVHAGGLGVACGNGMGSVEQVLYTTDGISWSVAPFAPTTSSWACSVPTAEVAYSCSFSGDLWRYEVTLGMNGEQGTNLRIFPVPATDMLYVHLPPETDPDGSLVLMDMEGRVMHTQRVQGSTTSITRAGWASGVYTIHVKVDEGPVAVSRVIFE